MNIVTPHIEKYLLSVAPDSESVAAEMERLAAQRHFPIVGPLVGRLLMLLSRVVDARRVFECGSGFGYSALWFARGMRPEGCVILTDGREENCAEARAFLGRAGLAGCTDVRRGDALKILEAENDPFDIIFCDIDKRGYPGVHPLVGPRLRPGGLFVCDNMLWFGKVAGPDQDDDTRGVRELTRLLYADPSLQTTILPLRDGVSVSVRL